MSKLGWCHCKAEPEVRWYYKIRVSRTCAACIEHQSRSHPKQIISNFAQQQIREMKWTSIKQETR